MKENQKAGLLFCGICILFGAVTAIPVDWSTLRPATCLTLEGCFCEAQRAGSVLQPVNAWSSLSFTLAGLLVWSRSWKGKNRKNGLIYAAALVITGLGSAFYHASLTFIGQFFDVLGMYLLATCLIMVRLQNLGWIRHQWTGRLYIGCNLVLAGLLIMQPELRRWIFLGLILAVLAMEAAALHRAPERREKHYLWAALSAFALAFLVWNLDNAHIWCVPASLWQGHALWHLLGATAGWCIWIHLEEG